MKIGISIITSDNRKVETIALIDSGAKGANFISRNFAERSKIPLLSLTKRIPVLNVDGTENQGGSIREYAEVTLKVQGRTCNVCLLITSLGRERLYWDSRGCDKKTLTLTGENRHLPGESSNLIESRRLGSNLSKLSLTTP